MREEEFSDNFVWYEWGFVSPSDLPTDDPTPVPDPDTSAPVFPRSGEPWSDDRPWMT